MRAIRAVDVKSVEDEWYKRHFFTLKSAELSENVALCSVRVCCPDFDSNIFRGHLVDGKPSRGEGTMAELVYNPIPVVKSIINMDWMISSRTIVREMLYSLDKTVLNIAR